MRKATQNVSVMGLGAKGASDQDVARQAGDAG